LNYFSIRNNRRRLGGRNTETPHNPLPTKTKDPNKANKIKTE